MPQSIFGKLKFANHSEMVTLTQFVLIDISSKTAIGFSVTGIVNIALCVHVSVVV